MRNSKLLSSSAAPLTWGQVSASLLDAERKETWRADYPSFSKWLEAHAEELGRSSQSCWRYFSAGKEYLEVRKILGAQGRRLPNLNDVPATVSPESIELLAKIRRVAPKSLLQSIEVGVLTGDIERKELRGIWETYAPLLQGKTARGRGARPETVVASREERETLDVIAGLRRSRGEWLSAEMGLFELYSAEEIGLSDEGNGLRADALIVCREKGSCEIQIHGLVFVTSAAALASSAVRALDVAKVVDRSWLVGGRAMAAEDLAGVSEVVGVMTVTYGGTVRVLRSPFGANRQRTLAEEMTRRVLGLLRK